MIDKTGMAILVAILTEKRDSTTESALKVSIDSILGELKRPQPDHAEGHYAYALGEFVEAEKPLPKRPNMVVLGGGDGLVNSPKKLDMEAIQDAEDNEWMNAPLGTPVKVVPTRENTPKPPHGPGDTLYWKKDKWYVQHSAAPRPEWAWIVAEMADGVGAKHAAMNHGLPDHMGMTIKKLQKLYIHELSLIPPGQKRFEYLAKTFRAGQPR